MKYMVLECHPSYAVVLDEDGKFLKVANMRYEVGQVVTEVVEMKAPAAEPQRKPKNKWLYSVAALAASLLLIVTTSISLGQQPYASVYLTINPEVRIDVNRKDIVVDVEGLNADGEVLLANYSYKKKDLDLVMDELVDRAIDMGFLHAGGQITLTLDAEDNEWVLSHEDTLGTHLNEYLEEKMSVTIEIDGAITKDQQITIPVGESGGKTDNADDDTYGESDYAEEDDTYGESDYAEEDDTYGESDYGDIAEEADSQPQDTQLQSGQEGESDYSEPDDPQTEYGQSLYEESVSDDGQSAYE